MISIIKYGGGGSFWEKLQKLFMSADPIVDTPQNNEIQNNEIQNNGTAYYVVYPEYEAKDDISGLSAPTGHAGVLTIDNNGKTRYREYGRYDSENKGIVRHPFIIPNAKMKNGAPTKESLNKIWETLSNKNHNNSISATPYDVDVDKVNHYWDSLYVENRNPEREKYNLFNKNCSTESLKSINEGGGNTQIGYLSRILPIAGMHHIGDHPTIKWTPK